MSHPETPKESQNETNQANLSLFFFQISRPHDTVRRFFYHLFLLAWPPNWIYPTHARNQQVLVVLAAVAVGVNSVAIGVAPVAAVVKVKEG